MTTINNNSTYLNNGSAPASGKSNGNLGQADFLLLMSTQMQNQDPLKPLDSAQMVAQLAQFSTVQGIEGLNQSMNSMASVMESDQTLRATQMAGKDVLVEVKNLDYVKGTPMEGEVVAERAGAVQVDIVDATGKRVARRTVEAKEAGPVAFQWDGKDDVGNPIDSGKYTIKATADVGDGASELSVRVKGTVSGVSLENYVLALQIPGLGEFGLGDVRRVTN